MTDPIVVIGSGLAGYTLAREFRKLDKETPFVVVTRDGGGFYSKPMLSNALSQGKSAGALVTTGAESMSGQLGIEVRPGVVVGGIDAAAKTIRLADGEALAYGRLVLALGADPIRLPLAGDAADAVLSVNDVDDYARFRTAIDGARRIAVIGAGLIGCEFANDLAQSGFEVEVVDLAPAPLGRLAPPEVGAFVRDRLAAIGIRWHLARKPVSVDPIEGGLRLSLDDGAAIEADVVLSAVGLRPRTALAAAAGLKVNRGIVVDRFLATSDPDVFALGDCAEVDGLCLPYVMPIMQAARALAPTLAGKPTPVAYPAMPVVVKTPAAPCVAATPPNRDGQWRVKADTEGVRGEFVTDDGALIGFALAGAAVTEKQSLTKQLPSWLDAAAQPA